MSSRLLALLVLLTLALLGGAVGWLLEAGPEPASPAAVVQPLTDLEAEPPTPREGRSAPVPRPTAPDLLAHREVEEPPPESPATWDGPEGDGSVTGRVVCAGEPVEGARILLTWAVGRGTPGFTQQATSGADGRFEQADLPAVARMNLRVEQDGLLSALRSFSLAPGAPRDLGDIPLRRCAEVRGRVRGPEASPPAGTVVQLSPGLDAVVTAEGTFEFRNVPPGVYQLQAEAPELVSVPYPGLSLGEGEAMEDIELVLVEPQVLLGRVLDSHGRPLEDGVVVAQCLGLTDRPLGSLDDLPRATRQLETRSGTDGLFEFAALLPGTYRVQARDAAAGSSEWREWDTRRGGPEMRLRLRPPRCTVRIEVVDELTGALLNVDSLLVYENEDPDKKGWSRRRRIGEDERLADGAFLYVCNPPTWVMVRCEPDELGAAESQPLEISGPGSHGPLRIERRGGPRLRGRVADSEGRGLGEVTLQFRGEDPTSVLKEARRLTASTALDGSFTSPPLSPGEYRIELHRSGYLTATPEPLRVGSRDPEPVEWEMEQGATLAGILFTRDEGTMPAFQVTAEPQTGDGLTEQARVRTATNQPTSFRFQTLAPGAYRLVCEGPDVLVRVQEQFEKSLRTGRSSDRMEEIESLAQIPRARIELGEVVLLPGEDRWLEVSLDETRVGRLSGQVVVNGEFLPLARVSVHCGSRKLASCSTDADGMYRFVGLPEALVRVTAQPDERIPELLSGETEIRAHGETRLDLQLSLLKLAGVVVDDLTGQPLAGARVSYTLQGAEGRRGRARPVRCDDRGEFQLPRLPVRQLLLSAEQKGYLPARDRPIAQLPRVADRNVELRLRPAGQIRVIVEGKDGQPLEGSVRLVYQPEEGKDRRNSGTRNGPVPPDGWKLGPLAEGTYEVVVRHLSSGRKARASCEVQSSSTARVRLEL